MEYNNNLPIYLQVMFAVLMGHAKEIITIDVYGDNQEIIEDCLENLEPFIDEVLPEEEVIDLCDVDCMDLVALELIE